MQNTKTLKKTKLQLKLLASDIGPGSAHRFAVALFIFNRNMKINQKSFFRGLMQKLVKKATKEFI